MKKLVFFVAVFGALILGLTSNVKAQTITFYCILDLSDTCNGGGYHGYYDVTVELWTYGGSSPICTGTGTTTARTHCVALTCSCSTSHTTCTYQEILTYVQRHDGTCGISPNMPLFRYFMLELYIIM